ncbi:putative methyltransferase NSUN5-like protein [Corchorus olitorius]|uniref:Methyltransferase NSUN5-like protein n=1 Tax=Corchorus olitorius TaxID=93759 RepID=A0A1R3GXW0_9ROSI|nr:putative methyltransferase NSUN5-like protein [Corchorus olitorius]
MEIGESKFNGSSGSSSLTRTGGQAANIDEVERLNKLASFQKKALAQALSC